MRRDLLLKERCGLRDVVLVAQVAGRDHKSTTADTVGLRADDEDLVLRVVGDRATSLLVLGVAVENDTSDSALDVVGQLTD